MFVKNLKNDRSRFIEFYPQYYSELMDNPGYRLAQLIGMIRIIQQLTFFVIQTSIAVMQRNIKLCLTGACGKLAYSLFIPICSGLIFGQNVSIDLRLVDLSDKYDQLKIIHEELSQCCFKNVSKINIFDERDQQKPFQDIDLALFLGGMPRKPGMEKKQVFQINAQIFQRQGRYLQKVAKTTCKSLVIANPSCTNCMILANNAPKIPKQNFTCLTRLDYNKFLGFISKHLECQTNQIKNIILWGNHSRKKFLDANNIEVSNMDHGQVLQKLKTFDLKSIEKVMYERGGYILQKSNGNCIISATTAIIDHLHDWLLGSEKIVSMGVYLTKETYGLPQGICFSMPTRCLGNGRYEIVENIELNQQQKTRIAENKQQLLKERMMVTEFNNVSN